MISSFLQAIIWFRMYGVSCVLLSFVFLALPLSSAYDTCDLLTDLSEGGEFEALTEDWGVTLSFGTGEVADVVLSSQRNPDDVISPLHSSTKWITSVTILRVVEAGFMELDGPISTYFDWWTTDPSDPRSKVTLRHLLSMTSGFGLHDCAEYYATTLEICVKQIYEESYGKIYGSMLYWYSEGDVDPETVDPGEYFAYFGSSMMIAGLAAVKATSSESFHSLFRAYLAEPLHFSDECQWIFPSTENINLGDGLACSANDYSSFIGAYFTGKLLGPSLMAELERPQALRAGGALALGPGIQWGLGVMLKCGSLSCLSRPVTRVFSPGSSGVYGWIDRANGFWGFLGRDGSFMRGCDGEKATACNLAKDCFDSACRPREGLHWDFLPENTDEGCADLLTGEIWSGWKCSDCFPDSACHSCCSGWEATTSLINPIQERIRQIYRQDATPTSPDSSCNAYEADTDESDSSSGESGPSYLEILGLCTAAILVAFLLYLAVWLFSKYARNGYKVEYMFEETEERDPLLQLREKLHEPAPESSDLSMD